MKETENYEQLLERFYKRTTQLEERQVELEDAYQEYMKLDRDLDRLKGSIQAIEYCAYGKTVSYTHLTLPTILLV